MCEWDEWEVAVTRADIQRPFGIGLIASWACGDEDTRINPLLFGRCRAGHRDIIEEEGVRSHDPLVAVG